MNEIRHDRKAYGVFATAFMLCFLFSIKTVQAIDILPIENFFSYSFNPIAPSATILDSSVYNNDNQFSQTTINALLTYSIIDVQTTSGSLADSFSAYFFAHDLTALYSQQWQAQVGLFVINNKTPLQQSAYLHDAYSNIMYGEVNLGFRWGTSNVTLLNSIESYSVLFGYGLADKVEVNLGYSTLDIDEKFHESTFYEGTWYAGISAKF